MPREGLDHDAAVEETDAPVEAGARDQMAARRDGQPVERTGGLRPADHRSGRDVPHTHDAVTPDGHEVIAGEGEIFHCAPRVDEQARGSATHQVEQRDRPDLTPDRRDPAVGREGHSRSLALDLQRANLAPVIGSEQMGGRVVEHSGQDAFAVG